VNLSATKADRQNDRLAMSAKKTYVGDMMGQFIGLILSLTNRSELNTAEVDGRLREHYCNLS